VELRAGKLFFAFDGNNGELIARSKERFEISNLDGEVTFAPAEGGARQLVFDSSGRPPIVFTALAPLTPTAAQLADYAGNYYSEELDAVYKLAVKDGKLVLTRRKYGPLVPQAVAQDVFAVPGTGSIRFTRDAQGHVTGLVFSRGRIKNLRFDKQPQ
jgi:hypothetical protein